MKFIAESWHKILIGILMIDRLWDRIIEIFEKVKKTERFVERRIHLERRQPMLNPVTILQDLTLVSKAAITLQQAIPLLNKTVQDVRAAYASKGDAAAEEQALVVVLNDINEAVAGLSALFPPPTAAAV
jgi:hypothetical protein